MGKINLHPILIFFIVVLAVNMFFLDIKFFSRPDTAQPSPIVPEDDGFAEDAGGCNADCEMKIEKKVREALALRSPSLTPTPVASVRVKSQTKETFIPMGDGVTSSQVWEDLPSTDVYVDTSNYGDVQQVYFETHLRISTGNGIVYAKLYNVSDKHDVWFSEVSAEGGGTFRREAPVSLEPGKKLYRIAAKSSMGAEAYIENSNLRILAQ